MPNRSKSSVCRKILNVDWYFKPFFKFHLKASTFFSSLKPNAQANSGV